MAALGYDRTEAVCVGCADKLTEHSPFIKHFYLFISTPGLKRFCGASLHNSLVLWKARQPGRRLDTDMIRGAFEIKTMDAQWVPLVQIISEISHRTLIELY